MECESSTMMRTFGAMPVERPIGSCATGTGKSSPCTSACAVETSPVAVQPKVSNKRARVVMRGVWVFMMVYPIGNSCVFVFVILVSRCAVPSIGPAQLGGMLTQKTPPLSTDLRQMRGI